MATSENSYESIASKFGNGNALVQSWGDYNPALAIIKKAALATFVTNVTDANTKVKDLLQAVGDERDIRNPLVFKIKLTNPTCFEERIRGIRNYIKGESLSATAVKSLEKILLKFHPQYPKKDPAAPRGAGVSPMEKSFNSALGYARSVVSIITNLGGAYNPPDANLSVANMTTMADDIEKGNTNVALALDAYGNGNRARKLLFDGPEGLKKRRTAILNYLSSFPGLKKSDHYTEFNQAVK